MGKLFVKGYAVKGRMDLFNLDYVGSVIRGDENNPDRFCLAETYDKSASWVTCGDEAGHTRFEDCIIEFGGKDN